MHVRSRRLIALALGCLAAWALAWAWSSHRAAQRRDEHEQRKRRIYAIVDEHAQQSPAANSPTATAARSPEERAFYLTPELAANLFSSGHSSEVYDPWCYFRHVANGNVAVPWPEHPNGSWHWVTNSLGLREDREIASTKPALRVLVTGDSHTDGFCDNAESFPHVTQRELERDRPAGSVEVINAGNGGFTFYNYAGVLERFLDLAPDAFVVTIYSGNDFQDVMIPHAWFEHVPLPAVNSSDEETYARLRAASRPAYGQFFYSLAWFHHHPEAVEESLAAATHVMSLIRERCDERGIRLLCVLIPSAIDLPWGENAVLFEEMRLAASLTKEDLLRNDRMADELLARLQASGCETLDMRATFRAQTEPCFWTKDLHLNVRGHAACAQTLTRTLESWGGRFAR